MRFAGYAALFDRVDRGGDVVRPGAFAQAIAAGPARVPLLWQHEPARPIGRIEMLGEDARGLRVIGRLSERSAAGREAAALLRDGAVSGLSFGYKVRVASGERPRRLEALELVEVSLVTLPMQPGARVHAVERSEEALRRVERGAATRRSLRTGGSFPIFRLFRERRLGYEASARRG